MSDPHDQLKRLEAEADTAIAAQPLMRLPARALLAGIHYFLYQSRNAALLGLAPLPGVADTVTTRLSYLLPLIVGRPAEAFGQSARDAIEAFTEVDPTGAHLAEILAYSHFSEFMPEVHRGYYRIAQEDAGFRLVHRDAAFANAQAEDIILSELAIPFPLSWKRKVDPAIYQLAMLAPKLDPKILVPLLIRKTEFYLDGLAEANLVTADGMNRIFGFRYATFYRIRAAVMAFAEFAQELSVAIGRLSVSQNRGAGVSNETLEWVSVNYAAPRFVGLIAAICKADPPQIERFLSFYSVDFRYSPARHNGGDGFFPPFARFRKSYVFSPELVLSFTQVRNALFAFSREDRSTFDNHVSADLEPVLVSQAVELLRRSDAWVTRVGVTHETGEIDLIIAPSGSGPVLLVQAKGSLPPQGARLTERLADRMREGIQQIARFRALTPESQEKIVSRSLGRPVAFRDLRHGLLARACFGAPEAFARDLRAELLTLPTLSLALGAMRGAHEGPDVSILIKRLRRIRRRVNQESRFHWEEGETRILDRSIRMPLLKFDHEKVDHARRLAWHTSILTDPAVT